MLWFFFLFCRNLGKSGLRVSCLGLGEYIYLQLANTEQFPKHPSVKTESLFFDNIVSAQSKPHAYLICMKTHKRQQKAEH